MGGVGAGEEAAAADGRRGGGRPAAPRRPGRSLSLPAAAVSPAAAVLVAARKRRRPGLSQRPLLSRRGPCLRRLAGPGRAAGPFTRGDLRIRCDYGLMTSDARWGDSLRMVNVQYICLRCDGPALCRHAAAVRHHVGDRSLAWAARRRAVRGAGEASLARGLRAPFPSAACRRRAAELDRLASRRPHCCTPGAARARRTSAPRAPVRCTSGGCRALLTRYTLRR